MAARQMSGTSRPADQFPPPMTLPARAVATATPRGAKNDRAKARVSNSAAAFEAP